MKGGKKVVVAYGIYFIAFRIPVTNRTAKKNPSTKKYLLKVC
ncbi:hypothetical protein pipiens_020124, partial [Culex pipiens pipiens]